MMKSLALAFALSLALALALVASNSNTASAYMHVRQSSSVYYGHNAAGWLKRHRVDENETIRLVFAVRQRNLDKLEEVLLAVSDPAHPSWGKHLTLEQVGELTSDFEAANTVRQWLISSGVPSAQVFTTVNGDWIRAEVSASLAERLLGCEYYHFVHPKTGATAIRTELYHLPLAIADSVDFVAHTIRVAQPRPPVQFVPLDLSQFPEFSSLQSNNKKLGQGLGLGIGGLGDLPAGYCGPQTLFNYYGISNPTVVNSGATQSVYENLGQSFAPADLSSFQSYFGLPNQPVATVIGPNTPSSCAQSADNCIEADLDVEYIMALAQGSPTTFWSIANGDNEPFLDWIVAVSNSSSPPLVHSISYGDIETEDDPTSMNRFNTEAMKLGTRGVSIMVASGDDGVANFIARSDPTQCGFNPSFPATAPYVTAVGATSGPENNTAEVACTSSTGGGITTGGGFSTVFSQPTYQTSVVQNYLENGPNMPPTSNFNKGGRGYPDVAMMGHNYVISIGGNLSAGSGTSASSPVFAATISLINAMRLQAGKSPLGFLNQILYNLQASTPSAFHDITSGENNCCAGDPGQQTCCQYGFTATTGWDPLTGLGSINFPVFSQALVNLP